MPHLAGTGTETQAACERCKYTAVAAVAFQVKNKKVYVLHVCVCVCSEGMEYTSSCLRHIWGLSS